jgi:hypothetical protein
MVEGEELNAAVYCGVCEYISRSKERTAHTCFGSDFSISEASWIMLDVSNGSQYDPMLTWYYVGQ